MVELCNKSVLVTGAASGIGRACAARFAAEGARVIVTDITDEPGEECANAIGGEYVRLDVADPDAWRGVAEKLVERARPLAVAHLNAGIRLGAPVIADVSDAQYDRILGVNLHGVFYGLRTVVPLLERAGGGAVVITASRAALDPLPRDPCYAMTKHAVAGLVRSVAGDLARRGISVNAICPAIVDTGFLEGRRAELEARGLVVMEPEEVASGVMAVLASGESGRCFVQRPGSAPEPHEFARV